MKNKSFSPAKLRSASFDEEANTVDVVWSTGADVLREDWDGAYTERLLMGPENVRLDRLNSGAPFLDTHNSDGLSSVIGSVAPGSARIEGGKGVATIRLSSAATDADTTQKIREGVIKNISVGYWIHSSTRTDSNPPIVEVSDWEPLEVSAVPIPADPGSQIRSLRGSRAARKPMTKEQHDFQAGAAQATRLLGKDGESARASSDHQAGARMARRLLGGAESTGKVRVESAKPAALDKLEIERSARAALRLLRRKA